MRIGLISDTHGYLDERVFFHFENCDEIWHAGDVGDFNIIEQLESFKPLRGVYGNIDDQKVRSALPLDLSFESEGVNIFMIHIGGTPPRYANGVKTKLQQLKPQLFICGHSHILKVMPDHSLDKMLYMNPGAAGHHGFHKVRTLLRFEISDGRIHKLEVIELGLRGKEKAPTSWGL
jgi:putative phosphoesterase